MLEEFTLDCPTLRYVPSGARAAAAQATEELCHAALHAQAGTRDERRAWTLLTLRERLLFFAPLRLQGPGARGAGAETHDKARLVRERCSKLLRGEWAELLAEARHTGQSLARSRRGNASATKDETYLADEVVRKTLAGEYSRATALLASPGLAPLTPETADNLQGQLSL